MKLIQLEITRFGKFRDTVIDIEPGFWTLQQDNEWGKTTMADFIRFMFYGFEKSRARRTLLENPLERYQPWDSSDGLAGALLLEDEAGERYRLERTMNAKGKGQVRVLDKDGKEWDIPCPGEHFLGVDGETFMNVFYICQGDNSPRRTAGMDVAMKNLVTTGSEDVSYDAVMEHLQSKRLKYSSPKGGGGKLKTLLNEIEDHRRYIALEEMRLSEAESHVISTEELEGELTEIEKELEEIAVLQEQAAAYAVHLRQTKRMELQQKIEDLHREMEPLHSVDADTLERLESLFVLQDQLHKKIEQTEQQAQTLRLQMPPPGEKEQTAQQYQHCLQPPKGAIVGIVLFTWLCIGGIVGGVWQLWCWILALVGGAGLTLSLIKMIRLPAPLQTCGIHSRKELAAVLQVIAWQQQTTQKLSERLVALEEQTERYQKELAGLHKEHQVLMQTVGVEDRDDLEKLKKQQNVYMLLAQKEKDLQERLQEMGQEDRSVASAIPPEQDDAKLKERRDHLLLDKERHLRALADSAAENRRLKERRQSLTEMQHTLVQKQAQYERDAAAHEIILLAIEQMEAAQSALRENYAPLLRKALEQKLSLLTDGKYDTVTLDEGFALRIKAQGGLRPLDYFSAGTRDAAYLALRLSLAEIVEGEHRLPLIFDDPFLNLDEKRWQNLFTHLKELGRERQILLFSCQKIGALS